jgi:hypothetical protein
MGTSGGRNRAMLDSSAFSKRCAQPAAPHATSHLAPEKRNVWLQRLRFHEAADTDSALGDKCRQALALFLA